GEVVEHDDRDHDARERLDDGPHDAERGLPVSDLQVTQREEQRQLAIGPQLARVQTTPPRGRRVLGPRDVSLAHRSPVPILPSATRYRHIGHEGTGHVRYRLCDIDLGRPVGPVALSGDDAGVAALFRWNGRPVAFAMIGELGGAVTLTGEDLNDLATRHGAL